MAYTVAPSITPLERRRRELYVRQGLSSMEWRAFALYRAACHTKALAGMRNGGEFATAAEVTHVLEMKWARESEEVGFRGYCAYR